VPAPVLFAQPLPGAAAPPPETPEPLFERFPDGLTTAEVAALLAKGPDYPSDVSAAERALVELVAAGKIARVPLGQDALWRQAGSGQPQVDDRTAAAFA
jgi:hypothetical protein